MARRRRKRTSGIEAFASIVGALVGAAILVVYAQPGLRHRVVADALLVATTAIAVFTAALIIALRLHSSRRKATHLTVASPVDPAQSDSSHPATPTAPRSANQQTPPVAAKKGHEVAIRDGQPPTEWSMELLKRLEWKRFEALCAGYFNAAGGLTARTTRLGADGGVDIYLYSPVSPNTVPVGVVQCKAWNTYRVGVKPVRELFGVMAAEKARIGIFATTGDYTEEAKAFATDKHLQLLTGQDLLAKLRSLPATVSARLLAETVAGDYTTPTCPQCGVKMVARSSRKDGRPFWGCANYPRCRQTLRQSVAT